MRGGRRVTGQRVPGYCTYGVCSKDRKQQQASKSTLAATAALHNVLSFPGSRDLTPHHAPTCVSRKAATIPSRFSSHLYLACSRIGAVCLSGYVKLCGMDCGGQGGKHGGG